MIDADGGAEFRSTIRIKCGLGSFKNVPPLKCSKVVLLEVKAKLKKACVQAVLLHDSETYQYKRHPET